MKPAPVSQARVGGSAAQFPSYLIAVPAPQESGSGAAKRSAGLVVAAVADPLVVCSALALAIAATIWLFLPDLGSFLIRLDSAALLVSVSLSMSEPLDGLRQWPARCMGRALDALAFAGAITIIIVAASGVTSLIRSLF